MPQTQSFASRPDGLSRAKVYELLAQDLADHGIETVFGLMSDDTALLVNALEDRGVHFLSARHENSAVAMAEGHAWATGRTAVALIGRGPAAANCVNAAIHASRTGSSVLIIYGDAAVAPVSGNEVGPDLKALDALRLLQGAGLPVLRASSADTARGTLVDALKAASVGQAVAMLLPTNVQQAVIWDAGSGNLPPAAAAAPIRVRPQALKEAARLLETCCKPLIIAGWGAHRADAREAIERLAERSGALLATTLKGKDMFRGHPYNLGIIGSFSHSVGRRCFDEADFVLVLGASLNALTTNWGESLPRDVPIVHVDRNRSAIGRHWHADVGIVGDVGEVVESLSGMIDPETAQAKTFRTEAVRAAITGLDHRHDYQPADTDWTVDPRSAGLLLNELLPPTRNVIMDVGNFFGVVPYIDVPGPGHLKYSADFGSIGLGFGTALGVARARPDAPTILFIGDGSFLMTMGELATVTSEDLPLVIIVMNDSAYGAERHFLELREHPISKSMFPMIDFAPIAEAFGFETATVSSLEDLKGLAPLLAHPAAPILIDLKVNPAVQAPFMGEFARAEQK